MNQAYCAVTNTGTHGSAHSIAGQMVAVRSAGVLYYTYSDHLGSVVGMTNATGGIIANSLTRYDPFGNYRTPPGTAVNPDISDRGFTGHRGNNTGEQGIQNLNLIYMNARYYMPEIGRFISTDTIIPDPANPQSYNRYSYAFNNPVKYTDPSGHFAQCLTSDSNGDYESCDAWMLAAISFLGLNGGLEGARLAELFGQWLKDPTKMLLIKAFNSQPRSMFTRQPTPDSASIFLDKDLVSHFDFDRRLGDIALLGHELEHVSQGTFQAWSIQGEILAYQVEFRIRAALHEDQSLYTNGAMGIFEGHTRAPYDANSYEDLVEARTGFLRDSRGSVNYDTWREPNLPWGSQIGRTFLTGLQKMGQSLNVDGRLASFGFGRWVP